MMDIKGALLLYKFFDKQFTTLVNESALGGVIKIAPNK